MEDLEEYYLSFFPDDRQPFARELLDLARASYRLRDDDNIYLGRIRGHCEVALDEGRKRLGAHPGRFADEDIPKVLRDRHFVPSPLPVESAVSGGEKPSIHARQLVGSLRAVESPPDPHGSSRERRTWPGSCPVRSSCAMHWTPT